MGGEKNQKTKKKKPKESEPMTIDPPRTCTRLTLCTRAS